jgi:hypothetical protein
MATEKHRRPDGFCADVQPATNGRWLTRLGMYHRKRALTFQTQQDLHTAIDAIWNPADELYRMPHAPADALTMIVPDDAVPVFRARQLRFVESPVMPAVRRPSQPNDSNVA